MTKKTFHWEVKDLVTMFVAAFDNVVIQRFNKDRASQGQVQARYLYSPKQRVIYDLVNKAQNITLPVIAVSISSVNRAVDRVFNKIPGFYFPRNANDSLPHQLTTTFVGTPIPVDIGVNMSIMTKFQSDMDQILSNFIPYTNPYIILSWKIPTGFSAAQDYEIRSEVLWNGGISLTYPIDLAAGAKGIITGDTSFTIKGWLFPAAPTSSTGNIIYIDANLYASSVISLSSTYESLTGSSYTYPVSTLLITDLETISLTGISATGAVSARILS